MAADSIEQIIREVSGLTDADPNLARIWVRDAARRTFEARHWSFMLKHSFLSIPAAVTNLTSLSTCSISSATPDTVTFSSALVTQQMVGSQFRVSTLSPIFEIVSYLSSSSFRIDPPWPSASLLLSGFSIFRSRIRLPSACIRILSAVGTASPRWRLNLDVQQETLDFYDPNRSRYGTGNPAVIASLDYSTDTTGKVFPALGVVGSGTRPIAAGSFTGQSDSVYTIVITTGGAGGVAAFTWRRNEESIQGPFVSSTTTGNALADGVTLLWEAAAVYTLSNVFTVRASSVQHPGVPRVEIYPTPSAGITIPIYYLARYPDVTDDDVPLPGILAFRSDVIKEKALEFASTYAGTTAVANPSNQINRRDYYAASWRALVEELGQQDNELFQRNVQQILHFPLAPFPWGVGGRNSQDVDDPWIYPI